jgi:KDO2-lipid IV(A) lauroyltransferase
MRALSFYLLHSLLWVITWLPLNVLYVLSDFLFLLIYYVSGYRKKIVRDNLRNSFPEWTETEVRRTARRYYRQLTDYFIEWIYRFHMGERELERRMIFKNPEILQKYYDQGKSIMLLLSHYGNWEWPTRLPLVTDHPILVVYKPLQNKYFDRLFLNLRKRFGAIGIPMESTLRSIIQYDKKGQPVLVYNLADQRPQLASLQYWTRFMNQDTPVILGSEKIAVKFGMVAIFLAIRKVDRGYYEAEFRVLEENPSSLPKYRMTSDYLRELETLIKERPELYLWSHRRWSYRREHTAKELIEF